MEKIRKFVLSLAMFLFFVVPAFAQAPVKIYYSDDAGGETAVSPANPLPITGAFSISGVATEVTLAQILAEMTNGDTRAWILNWPSSYPVTGTFWQTTQPVSGTFYQTTQPISGTVTATMADVTLSDTIYEITLTDTATVDSSIVLPAKCTGFELWGQTSTHTIKWMLTSGTYAVQPPGTPYNTFDKGLNALYSGRLYLKDTTEAGAKVTVIVWTKP